MLWNRPGAHRLVNVPHPDKKRFSVSVSRSVPSVSTETTSGAWGWASARASSGAIRAQRASRRMGFCSVISPVR